MTDIIIGKIKFVPLSKSRYFIREASQFTVFYWPASSRIIVSAREVIRFLVPKIAQIISGLLATLYLSLQGKVLLLSATDGFPILTTLMKKLFCQESDKCITTVSVCDKLIVMVDVCAPIFVKLKLETHNIAKLDGNCL